MHEYSSLGGSNGRRGVCWGRFGRQRRGGIAALAQESGASAFLKPGHVTLCRLCHGLNLESDIYQRSRTRSLTRRIAVPAVTLGFESLTYYPRALVIFLPAFAFAVQARAVSRIFQMCISLSFRLVREYGSVLIANPVTR